MENTLGMFKIMSLGFSAMIPEILLTFGSRTKKVGGKRFKDTFYIVHNLVDHSESDGCRAPLLTLGRGLNHRGQDLDCVVVAEVFEYNTSLKNAVTHCVVDDQVLSLVHTYTL